MRIVPLLSLLVLALILTIEIVSQPTHSRSCTEEKGCAIKLLEEPKEGSPHGKTIITRERENHITVDYCSISPSEDKQTNEECVTRTSSNVQPTELSAATSIDSSSCFSGGGSSRSSRRDKDRCSTSGHFVKNDEDDGKSGCPVTNFTFTAKPVMVKGKRNFRFYFGTPLLDGCVSHLMHTDPPKPVAVDQLVQSRLPIAVAEDHMFQPRLLRTEAADHVVDQNPLDSSAICHLMNQAPVALQKPRQIGERS
ncbi:hypothetical protein FA10DRAFT_281544 [Acaromyces ingoldii]|uniref:Uncharacterized protein n=1 Tax=Acaromyces ingoldii TaxID=215250 RepID=A0A316YEK7_9BASI|nr:hypothetical protein FA10DRAFT_281544 [Acaromyces ingoldii]PWN87314.1 hypothetical protein FA10DRAFT_281544 [Acaromyces ingoldii]